MHGHVVKVLQPFFVTGHQAFKAHFGYLAIRDQLLA